MTFDPSIPQRLGAQLGICSESLFSSPTLLPHATPFPRILSMWSAPQVGSAPLQQQNNPIQNQNSNALFTPGSVGLFHPGSGGFPPFPSDNFNANPTSRSFVSLPFRWNWNSNTSHGPQNVGLAFSELSSQQLGNNPLFGVVGGTPPLGKQSVGSQPITTPQQNVGFNPYSMQQVGGTLVSSQPPLGPTPMSFNV